jgi:hypothetical protein
VRFQAAPLLSGAAMRWPNDLSRGAFVSVVRGYSDADQIIRPVVLDQGKTMDIYRVWRAALRNEIVPASEHIPTGVGGVDGHPQPGIYKRREGGGYEDGKKVPHSYVPVRIYVVDAEDTPVHTWTEGCKIKAIQGADTEVDALKVWGRCQTKIDGKLIPAAITKEMNAAWLASGAWPDESPRIERQPVGAPVLPDRDDAPPASAPPAGTVGIGHNSEEDPEGIEALQALLDQQRSAIDAWLGQERAGETAANQAGNWLKELRTIEARVTAAYETEAAPINAKLVAIRNLWRPLRTTAEALKDRMSKAYAQIASAEKARLQKIADDKARALAEQARAKAAADAAAKQEAERNQRAQAAQERGDTSPEPVPPPVVIQAPTIVVEPVRVAYGGASGSKIGLKTKRSAVITDWAAAAQHYANAQKVREAVQKLADADARNGIACPGATIASQEVAA